MLATKRVLITTAAILFTLGAVGVADAATRHHASHTTGNASALYSSPGYAYTPGFTTGSDLGSMPAGTGREYEGLGPQ